MFLCVFFYKLEQFLVAPCWAYDRLKTDIGLKQKKETSEYFLPELKHMFKENRQPSRNFQVNMSCVEPLRNI